ncbi:MAG TPA: YcxB family protein, partial [Pyrinomonadaceae bacterium]
MLETVTLNVQFTRDDYLRVLRFMTSQSFIVKYGPPIAFAVLFLFIFGFILFLSDGQLFSIPAALLVSFFPAAVASGAIYLVDRHVSAPFLKFSIGKQMKSNPLFEKEVTITFDDGGISTATSHSSTSINWEGIIRAVETETDFLFYTTNKFAY